MKYRILILHFFLLFSAYALSQKSFETGFIVTNEFDTVVGYVANNSYAKNALICEFKDNENATIEKYKPSDIHSYKFEPGKYYISKKVTYRDSVYHVFLEYLINGKLNVYFARLKREDVYFAQKEGGDVYFLENKEVYFDYDAENEKWVPSKNKTIQKVGETARYKGLLTYVTKEAPSLQNQIANITLGHKSLINLAKKYHYKVCADEDCTIYEKKDKPWATVGVVQGYSHNLNPLKLPDSRKTIEIDNLNLPGLELSVQFLRVSERVSLKAQVYFYSSTITKISQIYGEKQESVFLKVPFVAGYDFITGNITPYVNGGVVFNSLFYADQTDFELFNGALESEEFIGREYFGEDMFKIGAVLSVGVKYYLKDFYIDGGVEYDFYGKSYVFTMLRPRIGLGYRFN